MSDIQAAIEAAFEAREHVTPASEDVRAVVDQALGLLDSGAARVAEPNGNGGWKVNQWLKKAVLLSFRLADNDVMAFAAAGAPAFDKVPLKFEGWGEDRFREAGIRVVPGAVVRRSAFIARGAVLMPSFVNLGAYVGEGTIVIVGEGAVLSMGVFIGASTKIVDRATGTVHVGKVPAYSVVVPGSLPGKPLPDGTPGPSLYCAVIVKTVDAQTRAKTGINELLRD
jgi:2,3,4,5-tetrahydropyridine-2-carboxylate N-succinyltransferase